MDIFQRTKGRQDLCRAHSVLSVYTRSIFVSFCLAVDIAAYKHFSHKVMAAL
jgi:hypothetical protein